MKTNSLARIAVDPRQTRRHVHLAILLAVVAVLASLLIPAPAQAADAGSDRYEYVVESGQYFYLVDTVENSRTWAGGCTNLGTPTVVDWPYIQGLAEAAWATCDELAERLNASTPTPGGGSDRYEYVVESGQYFYLVDTVENSRTWAGGCTNLGTPTAVDWPYIQGLAEAAWATCDDLAERLDTNTPETATLPASGAGFDYQIGGDYTPDSEVQVLSRDWYVGSIDPTRYNICYVNPFQTQGEGSGDRADLTGAWLAAPLGSQLVESFEDPGWPGEKLINISTPARRQAAMEHMKQILNDCEEGGFDAVEFDNLDSWTRQGDGIPVSRRWTREDAAEYAKLLVDYTHSLGLAAAQKNTTDFFEYSATLGMTPASYVGFDFAITENCGRYSECDRFLNAYDGRVFNIEYPCPTEDIDPLADLGACSNDVNNVYLWAGVDIACGAGPTLSVVIRDLGVEPSSGENHLYMTCDDPR